MDPPLRPLSPLLPSPLPITGGPTTFPRKQSIYDDIFRFPSPVPSPSPRLSLPKVGKRRKSSHDTVATEKTTESGFMPVLGGVARQLSRGQLGEVGLREVLDGETCDPISFKDFEAFLTHKEHSLENLLFLIWFKSYQSRYLAALPAPSPTSSLSLPIPDSSTRPEIPSLPPGGQRGHKPSPSLGESISQELLARNLSVEGLSSIRDPPSVVPASRIVPRTPDLQPPTPELEGTPISGYSFPPRPAPTMPRSGYSFPGSSSPPLPIQGYSFPPQPSPPVQGYTFPSPPGSSQSPLPLFPSTPPSSFQPPISPTHPPFTFGTAPNGTVDLFAPRLSISSHTQFRVCAWTQDGLTCTCSDPSHVHRRGSLASSGGRRGSGFSHGVDVIEGGIRAVVRPLRRASQGSLAASGSERSLGVPAGEGRRGSLVDEMLRRGSVISLSERRRGSLAVSETTSGKSEEVGGGRGSPVVPGKGKIMFGGAGGRRRSIPTLQPILIAPRGSSLGPSRGLEISPSQTSISPTQTPSPAPTPASILKPPAPLTAEQEAELASRERKREEVKGQLMRAEAERAYQTFLRRGGGWELNVSQEVVRGVREGLEGGTDPSVFQPVYDEIFMTVETQSLPHFLSFASANVNLPKQVFWYIVGLTDIAISLLIFFLLVFLTPPQPTSLRAYRLFSVLFGCFGAMQTYSAWRGFCQQVYGRASRQVHPWEMDDEEAMIHGEEGDEEEDGFAVALGGGGGGGSELQDQQMGVGGKSVMSLIMEEEKEDHGFSFPMTPLPLGARAGKDVGTAYSDTTAVDPSTPNSAVPLVPRPASPPAQDSPAAKGRAESRKNHTKVIGRSLLRNLRNRKQTSETREYKKPAIFGPEVLVLDERVLALHRRVVRDILVFGGIWAAVWLVICMTVPGQRR